MLWAWILIQTNLWQKIMNKHENGYKTCKIHYRIGKLYLNVHIIHVKQLWE